MNESSLALTVNGSTATAGRVGFREALWFEWTKFATLRSNLVVTGVLGVALPLFAVIVAATESLQRDDTILGASVLGGAVLAQILAAALGAMLVTGEIRTGMMRTTLVACPRHLAVLAAKATVAAGVVAAVILPGSLASFGIGLLMLDRDVYATGQPFPAVIGIALSIASMGVLGVAIGTLIRHSAGAVMAAVAVVLLPQIVASMLGDYERWLGGASLAGVMQKLTQSSDATHETVGSLGAWPSLGVVAAYTIAAVGLAVWTLRRRDS
jgi:ABC-2 type transport system permease protein